MYNIPPFLAAFLTFFAGGAVNIQAPKIITQFNLTKQLQLPKNPF
ncbi:hypothetical protein [Vibrio phage J14]|nr:hypothetical protein [Vibrio phage J14]